MPAPLSCSSCRPWGPATSPRYMAAPSCRVRGEGGHKMRVSTCMPDASQLALPCILPMRASWTRPWFTHCKPSHILKRNACRPCGRRPCTHPELAGKIAELVAAVAVGSGLHAWQLLAAAEHLGVLLRPRSDLPQHARPRVFGQGGASCMPATDTRVLPSTAPGWRGGERSMPGSARQPDHPSARA